ncbi:MAG: metalloregulator ArsR/SmtB family transcription factor [Rhodospirillaceae bacterium]|nr:metalloregulator ArsR/SmtB family transcription factor [Rhodospirillaceae bacterium]
MSSHAARLNLVFSALADPTRRAILARVARSEATVNELVEPFRLTQPAISKHLKVLETAGLISRGREAQTRPVRLTAAPLAEVETWLGDFRRFWEQRFDRLESYVEEMKNKEKSRDRRIKNPKRTRG